MPLRAPGAGVLGPRPPFQAHQAMTEYQEPQLPPTTPPAAWDNSALYTALTTAGITAPPPSASEWFLDTVASNHMSSSTGNLNSPHPLHSSIILRNGAQLPVTHAADTSFPTTSHPVELRNVFVSPSLVTNLVSVRHLTRDNHISIEFGPYGFSVKDLASKQETLRYDSSGELYPLWLPQPHSFTASMAPTVHLWHHRLGHPGSHSLSQVLHSFDFSCNKLEQHTCHSC